MARYDSPQFDSICLKILTYSKVPCGPLNHKLVHICFFPWSDEDMRGFHVALHGNSTHAAGKWAQNMAPDYGKHSMGQTGWHCTLGLHSLKCETACLHAMHSLMRASLQKMGQEGHLASTMRRTFEAFLAPHIAQLTFCACHSSGRLEAADHAYTLLHAVLPVAQDATWHV